MQGWWFTIVGTLFTAGLIAWTFVATCAALSFAVPWWRRRRAARRDIRVREDTVAAFVAGHDFSGYEPGLVHRETREP